MNLHHLPSTLTQVMGDGSDLGVAVRYSWEQPIVLGGAGGTRQALPIIGSQIFLIVNGDTLTDVDLASLSAAHAAANALITLALTPNRMPDRYGGVRLDGRSRVTGFVPRGSKADSFHMIGVQIARAEAFASLPAGCPIRSIGGAYDELIARQPGSIAGFVSEAEFWDIGTVSDYWHTSMAFLAREPNGAWHGRAVRISPGARIIRSVLWDDVTVGAGSVLEECIVTDGVRVPIGGTYRRSVLTVEDGMLRAAPFDTA